jgi:hypothetical protein
MEAAGGSAVRNNRVGRFKLDRQYLERLEELLPLMGNFVPVKAEYDYATQAIEITAYSPLFEVWPHDCAVPDYELTINITDFAPAEIIAKRITPKPK